MIKQFSFMTIPMTRERSHVKQIDGQTPMRKKILAASKLLAASKMLAAPEPHLAAS